MSDINIDLNDLITGEDVVSIHGSEDLFKESVHENAGYFVRKVLDDSTFELLKKRISIFVKHRVEKILEREISDFTLEKYHTYIQEDSDHSKIATWEMNVDVLSGIEDKMRTSISESLDASLKLKKILIDGRLQEVIGFRIVGPSKNDENPFHRDSWMKQWENTLNVWIPIAGCNKENSLVVVEDSHFWNESRICRTNNGVVYNNKKYKVSAAISTDYNVNLLTPDPQYGEALVFSPHLIHGNARNNSKDTTRVSLELRYERADQE
jgi:ectoine hydroxylase-related dioxygenase (phytanoyl-CoA dioxygenase family)